MNNFSLSRDAIRVVYIEPGVTLLLKNYTCMIGEKTKELLKMVPSPLTSTPEIKGGISGITKKKRN
jgi:hypothetical protein